MKEAPVQQSSSGIKMDLLAPSESTLKLLEFYNFKYRGKARKTSISMKKLIGL
jgi:hypothetical protein